MTVLKMLGLMPILNFIFVPNVKHILQILSCSVAAADDDLYKTLLF